MFDRTPRAYKYYYDKLMPIKDGTESVTESIELYDESESESGKLIQNVHAKG